MCCRASLDRTAKEVRWLIPSIEVRIPSYYRGMPLSSEAFIVLHGFTLSNMFIVELLKQESIVSLMCHFGSSGKLFSRLATSSSASGCEGSKSVVEWK